MCVCVCERVCVRERETPPAVQEILGGFQGLKVETMLSYSRHVIM